MRKLQFATLALVATLLALAGCNGTTDDTGTSSATASATGVWSGTDSVSGLAITAIVNAAGDAVFIRSDGLQFVGTAQVSGSTLAVTVDGYSNFGSTFSDGSTYGLGTVNGTVSTASGMTLSLSFTTNSGTAITGSWSLTYDSISTSGSSLATLSGNYSGGLSAAVVSITSSGVLTSQSGTDNCVMNGTVTTADSSTDIYEVSFSYENCTGNDAVLNGVAFSGLAVLDTNASPTQLVMQAVGSSSSVNYGIVSYLNLS